MGLENGNLDFKGYQLMLAWSVWLPMRKIFYCRTTYSKDIRNLRKLPRKKVLRRKQIQG